MFSVKPLTRAVAGACFILGAAPVAAQVADDADQQIASKVVVTATRAAKAIDKIPGEVSVISQR